MRLQSFKDLLSSISWDGLSAMYSWKRISKRHRHLKERHCMCMCVSCTLDRLVAWLGTARSQKPKEIQQGFTGVQRINPEHLCTIPSVIPRSSLHLSLHPPSIGLFILCTAQRIRLDLRTHCMRRWLQNSTVPEHCRQREIAKSRLYGAAQFCSVL